MNYINNLDKINDLDEINDLDDINDLDEINDYIYRWKKHYKMLNEIISHSNFNKKKIDTWRNNIDYHFVEKIKSKL